jgi:predicted Zn-dependent protease
MHSPYPVQQFRPNAAGQPVRHTGVIRTALLILLLISGFTLFRSLHASAAQILYHEAKYNTGNKSVRDILRLCEQSHRYYPHNYYFSIWASKAAWYLPAVAGYEARQKESAEYWCDVGLRQNKYNNELRLLKTWILAEESPSMAASYLREYVEWDFWNPYFHSVLAELYTQAGDVENAVAELRWLKGTRYHEPVKSGILAAWGRESKYPSVRVLPPGKDDL